MSDNTVNNGVNVGALLDAREALAEAPEAARFRWRATCDWVNGTHSTSSVNSFFGLGEDQHRKTTFNFEADHPEVFAAADKGATPVEYVLVGLASCLTASLAAIAQNRNLQLRSVKTSLEGYMDIQGILGMDENTRTGFDDVTVHMDIDADATREEIEALALQARKRSAVFDIVSNPTGVAVSVN